MFSRLSRPVLSITFVAALSFGMLACQQQSQPAAPSTDTAQAGKPNGSQLKSLPQARRPANMTPEQSAAYDRKMEEYKLKKAEEVRKYQEVIHNTDLSKPPEDAKPDPARVLLGYHRYLTEKNGLKINWPKEMQMGTSLFHAEDIIQMVMPETKTVIIAAKFKDDEQQALGEKFMQKLNADGRKYFKVGHYSLLVKGGDDNLYKTLTDALGNFEKRS